MNFWGSLKQIGIKLVKTVGGSRGAGTEVTEPLPISDMTKLLGDFYYGVTGYLRKRAKYRCEKRGENWEIYSEKFTVSQREIGKKALQEIMSSKNPFLDLVGAGESDYSFSGAFFPIPHPRPYSIRKRSKFRNQTGYTPVGEKK